MVFIFWCCLSLLLLSSSLAWADITSNLQGYWRFSDAPGTTAVDSSGNGNTGTLTGGASLTTGNTGLGGAVLLNGVDGWVSVNDAASLNITGTALTLAAWIRIDGPAGGADTSYSHIVGRDLSSTQYRMMLGESRDKLLFQASGGISVVTSGFAGGSYTLGTWHHVAITWNGTNAVFYSDGALHQTLAAAGTLSSTSQGNAIGKALTAGAYWLNGAIDEVRIYSRVLSGSDITELFTFTDPVSITAKRRPLLY